MERLPGMRDNRSLTVAALIAPEQKEAAASNVRDRRFSDF
jgi:hypothetical protein